MKVPTFCQLVATHLASRGIVCVKQVQAIADTASYRVAWTKYSSAATMETVCGQLDAAIQEATRETACVEV